jgi:restriction system protein
VADRWLRHGRGDILLLRLTGAECCSRARKASIVQAKRYKDAVGVNHVRELAGAMEEKRAGHGILVTTAWFTPRTWQKAREHGRIELIDGSRLVYLIKEYLGKDVLISVKRPRSATTGPISSAAVS